jgi:hypothetical protein
MLGDVRKAFFEPRIPNRDKISDVSLPSVETLQLQCGDATLLSVVQKRNCPHGENFQASVSANASLELRLSAWLVTTAEYPTRHSFL